MPKSPVSPLSLPGETEQECIERLLQEGTVEELLIEIRHWLDYWLWTEDGPGEPIETARALAERALLLISDVVQKFQSISREER